ncbi:hypothetical protein RAB80_018236 [Fusarium oxysporum f. sp. vasinfectum]|nr:hypothetical protein RAB80_018236 [Fusarium oxysporum f. sp. vasinfectum]
MAIKKIPAVNLNLKILLSDVDVLRPERTWNVNWQKICNRRQWVTGLTES